MANFSMTLLGLVMGIGLVYLGVNATGEGGFGAAVFGVAVVAIGGYMVVQAVKSW